MLLAFFGYHLTLEELLLLWLRLKLIVVQILLLLRKLVIVLLGRRVPVISGVKILRLLLFQVFPIRKLE